MNSNEDKIYTKLVVSYLRAQKIDILSRFGWYPDLNSISIIIWAQDDFKWKKFELQSCRSGRKL
jgi:hypothetical protein